MQFIAGFTAHHVLAPKNSAHFLAICTWDFFGVKVALAVEPEVDCVFILSLLFYMFSIFLMYQYALSDSLHSAWKLINQVLINLDIWGGKWIM